MLARTEYPGPEGATPLLIAHGLFGISRNWATLARQFSQSRPVITVDMRNHGASPWFDSHSYADMAADLAAEIDGQYDVLGHSMGGKAAMRLALDHPDKVRRLIVADIAPRAYNGSQLPQIEAMRRVELASVASRREAEAQMQAESPMIAGFLLQNLDMAERRWRLNLDVLERDMPKIMGWDDPAGHFDGPTLFLYGGASPYVRPKSHEAIHRLFPAARLQEMEGAGHWLHAEQPQQFAVAVEQFLTE